MQEQQGGRERGRFKREGGGGVLWTKAVLVWREDGCVSGRALLFQFRRCWREALMGKNANNDAPQHEQQENTRETSNRIGDAKTDGHTSPKNRQPLRAAVTNQFRTLHMCVARAYTATATWVEVNTGHGISNKNHTVTTPQRLGWIKNIHKREASLKAGGTPRSTREPPARHRLRDGTS